MKRKNASLLGNVLMGLGLVVMVVGVGYSILNQLPQLNLPQFFAHAAILCTWRNLKHLRWRRALAGRCPYWRPRAGQRPLLVGAPL